MASYMSRLKFQILFYLALFSFDASIARPFGAQLSSKKNHKDLITNTSLLRVAQPSSSQELAETDQKQNMLQEITVGENNNMQIIEVNADDNNIMAKNQKESTAKSSHELESSESNNVSVVAWRVPHKKKGEKQAVGLINLDYAPPKTHPPVHN